MYQNWLEICYCGNMTDRIKEKLLVNNEVYHVMSRSIANYQIFNTDKDYSRMIDLLKYYQRENLPIRYSMFLRQSGVQASGFDRYFDSLFRDYEKIIEIITYCMMPNHIHLVLKQLKENGISIFMSNILNSYTRYFNILHKRKGPLWESRFKHILVEKDEQLLHLTRYIHLNPTSAKLVKKPELWRHSSYLEYIRPDVIYRLTKYDDILEIHSKDYKKFVNDRKDYQQELSLIKKIISP